MDPHAPLPWSWNPSNLLLPPVRIRLPLYASRTENLNPLGANDLWAIAAPGAHVPGWEIALSLTLLAAFAWSAPALFADHGDHGKHGKHGNKHEDEQWERRDGYEYHTYQGDERPPGWGRGKKTGWGNCGLPPGQAKKYGCQTYVYQGRPHYYYQDEVGRIIVRRPIIEVSGSVTIH